eukprot:546131_1
MSTKQMWYSILQWLIITFTISQCYIFPTTHDFSTRKQLNWLEAESHCLSTYDTHLLSIHDLNTFQHIQNEISHLHPNYTFWIGLSSNHLWSDGTAFDFGHHLLPNISIHHPHTYYITLRYNPNAHELQWTHNHRNTTHFWICNTPPLILHVQNTQTTSITDSVPVIGRQSTNINTRMDIDRPYLYKHMIFIIIGCLFCMCCLIALCFLSIMKARTRPIKQNQSKHRKRIHSTLSERDRSSLDEGIMEKMNHMKQHKSFTLTVDMSTGHMVLSAGDMCEIEPDDRPHIKHNIKPKIYKRRTESIGLDCKDIKDVLEEDLKEEKEQEHTHESMEYNELILGQDEFIVGGLSDESVENRKMTDGFYANEENKSNDGSLLESEDSDGYYIDPEDKPFGGLMPAFRASGMTNQAMEGHCHDHVQLKGVKGLKGDTNDSDEEFYMEPKFVRKRTDGVDVIVDNVPIFQDELLPSEIAKQLPFMLSRKKDK